jgi:hypothetical protein
MSQRRREIVRQEALQLASNVSAGYNPASQNGPDTGNGYKTLALIDVTVLPPPRKGRRRKKGREEERPQAKIITIDPIHYRDQTDVPPTVPPNTSETPSILRVG